MKVEGTDLELDVSPMAGLLEKEKLTPDDWKLIVEKVVIPFTDIVNYDACSRKYYNYQKNVATAICFGVLSGNGWTYSVVQARQCIAGDQVIVDEHGSAHLMSKSPNSWVTNGEKECYTVTCEGGFEIDKVSMDHVFFTENGEKALRDISVGEKVWVNVGSDAWLDSPSISAELVERVNVHRTDKVNHKVEWSNDLGKFLGYMTTDGYADTALRSRQAPKFTNVRESILQDYESTCAALWPDLETLRREKGKGFDVYVRLGKRTNRSNDYIRTLRSIRWEHGFPMDVFDTNEEIASSFLSSALSGDGCIQPSRRTVELSCGNDKVYARIWQQFLLKLGIRAYVKSERMSKGTGTFHRLVISGNSSLRRLLDLVSTVVGKEKQYGELDNEVGRINERYPVLEVTRDGERMSLSSIKAIKPAGTHVVYDREVPGKGWFNCQGIKVHNSGKSETVACVVMGLGLLIPVLKKLLKDTQFQARFKSGFAVGCFAPTLDKSSIIFNRIKDKLSSKAALQIMQEAGDVDPKKSKGLCFSNGFKVLLRTAKKGANIEGDTFHLCLLDECLTYNAILTTEDGPMKIGDVVTKEYTGKVRAYDHSKGCEVWADVLGYLDRESTNLYEIDLGEGVTIKCTGNHKWYIEDVGYVETAELFSKTSSYRDSDGRLLTWIPNKRVETGYVHNLHTSVSTDDVHLGIPLHIHKVDEIQPCMLRPMQAGSKKSVQIRSIQKLSTQERVFDIKTSTGNFYVNGVLSHNCQEIDKMIIQKSIMPMVSTILGNIVMIGTPRPRIVYFKTALEKAKARDERYKRQAPYTEHHEYDWAYVAENNPYYLEHIRKTVEEIGRYSDAFRLAYDIEWIETTGRFISTEELMIGAVETDRHKKMQCLNGRTGEYEDKEFLLHAGTISSSFDETLVAFGIDYGKSKDSTVVTLAKVWWDAPVQMGDKYTRYHIHVLDWREMKGDNHEKQHPEIMKALSQYNVNLGVSDGTGMGGPIHERIEGALQEAARSGESLVSEDVLFHPFIFGPKSKHEGYTMLKQEICAGRVTFPFADYVKKYGKVKKFVKQFQQMEKTERENSNYAKFAHPDGDEYHDDFPDSLMMLVWAVNKLGPAHVESNRNPFKRKRELSWAGPRIGGNKRRFDGKSTRRKPFWR